MEILEHAVKYINENNQWNNTSLQLKDGGGGSVFSVQISTKYCPYDANFLNILSFIA